MHILYTQKSVLLLYKVLLASAEDRGCGILFFLDTLFASAVLPLRTTDLIKVSAMPRKAPAIVQGPYNRLARLFYIVKQQLDVDVISVQIVKMDDIGIILLDPLDKLFGRPF